MKLLEINCERKCGSGDEWPMEKGDLYGQGGVVVVLLATLGEVSQGWGGGECWIELFALKVLGGVPIVVLFGFVEILSMLVVVVAVASLKWNGMWIDWGKEGRSSV